MKKYSEFLNEGFVIRKIAPINKTEYPDIPGMEPPTRLPNGRVVYYDPKEGKYYDRKTDTYLSYEEYEIENRESKLDPMLQKAQTLIYNKSTAKYWSKSLKNQIKDKYLTPNQKKENAYLLDYIKANYGIV